MEASHEGQIQKSMLDSRAGFTSAVHLGFSLEGCFFTQQQYVAQQRVSGADVYIFPH